MVTLSQNKKTIFKTTLRIALPSIVESFFMALTGFIDSFMASSLGPDAVAAIGISTQPKFAGLSLYMALSVAISALVARRYGEKNRKGANSILSTALLFIVISSLILGFVFVIIAPYIIRFCGSTPETHDSAVIYYRIIMAGLIFNGIQMGINAAQRGIGNTKITMRTNITSNTVNIVFNYLLINGHMGFPALGIRGAAIATVFGSFVSSVMSTVSILKKDNYVSLIYIVKEKIRPVMSSFKSILKLGYSVFLEQILLRVGFMSTAIMAAHHGTNAMAAYQVCMNILGMSFSFGDGIQIAAVALIGKSLGERDPELAKDYGATCQTLGGIISVFIAIIYFCCSRMIMHMFFDEEEIISLGIKMMMIIIPIVLVQIRQVIYMGCLRGAGDTLFTAIVATVGTTVVRSGFAYLFAYIVGFGVVGIWLGILSDQTLRFVLSFIRFKKGKWTAIKI